MRPGAHLSHAARMAFDAQRALIAAVVHLEAADAMMTDLDERLAAVDLADDHLAVALDDLGNIATGLQCLADDYGHGVVQRTSTSPEPPRPAR